MRWPRQVRECAGAFARKGCPPTRHTFFELPRDVTMEPRVYTLRAAHPLQRDDGLREPRMISVCDSAAGRVDFAIPAGVADEAVRQLAAAVGHNATFEQRYAAMSSCVGSFGATDALSADGSWSEGWLCRDGFRFRCARSCLPTASPPLQDRTASWKRSAPSCRILSIFDMSSNRTTSTLGCSRCRGLNNAAVALHALTHTRTLPDAS